MATFTRSQRLLVSVGAAALGSAALLTLLAGNIVTLAGAGETAADISPPIRRPGFSGLSHAGRKRLAEHDASPGADRSAARRDERSQLRAGIRRYRAAALDRPRLRHLQDHDHERTRAGLFRSGPASRLRVQSRRGAARIPHGAEARSRLRHVLLGRGSGARAQHQSSDAGGCGRAGLCCRAEGESACRQSKPTRASADRRPRSALWQRSEGRPRAVRRSLRGRNGEGRDAISRR